MTLTRDDTTRLLGATGLFSLVDPDDLATIAVRMTELDVPAERIIARQGEIGTGFFVVASGSVRVVRDGQVVALLGPGDFFGEMSVLDGRPRVAQVVSAEPTVCLALASWDFEAVVAEQPSVALAILRELAGRLRDLTEAPSH
jgi:CRP/FNR family cyclic AMP-dependent transcriptional regulator